MGASSSSLNLTGNGSGNRGSGLGDMPESCVAAVLNYLTPPEICILARLNRTFRGAASADTVWEAKLPANYNVLFHLLCHPNVHQDQSLFKKDIFAVLSRPLPFEDSNKVVWVDRVTGGVCMSISAKAMAITGIEDRRYWNWVPTEESRFNVVAYLQQEWWFEVDGLVKFPFPPDTYTLSFRIHLGRFSKRLGRRICNFDHTHGWDIKPVKFELSISDGRLESRECFLDNTQQDDSNGKYKRGCWINYDIGQFVVENSDPATEVKFSMKQIDCTHSKGGLCVDSVSIIPSELKGGRNRGASV